MNFIFKHGYHPQNILLYVRKYSKFSKTKKNKPLKTKTFVVSSISGKEYSVCVEMKLLGFIVTLLIHVRYRLKL